MEKNFETSYSCTKRFDEFFYKSKIIKTMKFIPHAETVIKTLLKDYKSLTFAYEKSDLFTLRDRLMTRYNLFSALLT